ncbi:MAG: hypothetical protein ACE5HX_10795, partial [bacterium]
MLKYWLESSNNRTIGSTPNAIKSVLPHFNFVMKYAIRLTSVLVVSLALLSCGKDETSGNNIRRGAQGMANNRDAQMSAAIPVQVARVKRGDISTYLLQ